MKNISLIILGLLSFSFCISYVSVKKELGKKDKQLSELFEINYILLEQLKADDKTEDATHKENFIKYLSDSREWAFNYIENSQKIITEVIVELDKNNFKDLSKRLESLLPENE